MMKRIWSSILLLLIYSTLFSVPLHKPGQIIVKFRNELRGSLELQVENDLVVSNFPSVDNLLKKFQISSFRQFVADYDYSKNTDCGLDLIYIFQSGSDQLAVESIEYLNKNPWVDCAELNYIMENYTVSFSDPWVTATVPNDPYFFNSQWYLARIDAPAAWQTQTGDSAIIVAIIDDGCEMNHPDLYRNYMGGWDFVDNDDDPTPPADSIYHGTHCCGLAAAVTHNYLGIASIGYRIGLMGIRTGDDAASKGYAIYYACTSGANVISMSWGSDMHNFIIEQPITHAVDNCDIVCVAAAGNDDDSLANYPAFYDRVMAVAASDYYDQKASFSTYGYWIDITAPGDSVGGVGILSTVPYGDYKRYAGTSMAAPLTAGLVGLIRCQYPSENWEQIITRLYNSAVPMSSCYYYNNGDMGAGRINAADAINGGSGLDSDTITYWDWNGIDSSVNFGDSSVWMGMGVRFTQLELSPHYQKNIEQVIFQLAPGTNLLQDAMIFIFDQGTEVHPGDTLFQTEFTVSGDTQWYCIDLDSANISIDNSGDLWVLVGFTYDSADKPFPVNSGSYCDNNSDWIWTDQHGWISLVNLGYRVGWPVGFVVHHQVGVEEIIFPGTPENHLNLITSGNMINGNLLISFHLPQGSMVTLKVYDLTGREISTIISDYLDEGFHQLNFRGEDNRGNNLPRGTYFLNLSTAGDCRTDKFIVFQ